jgi:hypothetical protein
VRDPTLKTLAQARSYILELPNAKQARPLMLRSPRLKQVELLYSARSLPRWGRSTVPAAFKR